MSDEINLQERFPEMTPVRSAPTLLTSHGIGTMMYGKRDYDDLTHTYVKTQCLCFFFIPLLAFGSYRVLDDGTGGWYFFGKVPLSKFARRWNEFFLLMVACSIAFGIYTGYTNTPDYKAGQQLAQADKLAGEGKIPEAANIYRTVYQGNSSHAVTARERLVGLLDQPGVDLGQLTELYRIGVDFYRQNKPLIPDLYQRAVKVVQASEDKDPLAALNLYEVVMPLAPKLRDQLTIREQLLDRLIKAQPNNTDVACRLAEICEAKGDLKRCEALLKPHENMLGTSSGAAILGRIYARQGKVEPAFKLLGPYVDKNLPAMRQTDQQVNAIVQTLQQTVIRELQQETAPDFDYDKFKVAGEGEKRNKVIEYLRKRMDADPRLRVAEQERNRYAGVVPATLDLGLLLLQKGQGQLDPESRKKDLEKAEQTFLSVQEQAGHSDSYRLNLGKVYYWLGKNAEGKKLLDELLDKHKRGGEILLLVCRIVREVGDFTLAQSLAEECYKNEPNQKIKLQAAQMCAILHNELEEKITWLERCDQSNFEVKASLCECKGRKASRDGKDEDAIRSYKEAIETYSKMPESAATLNNSALVHFSIYSLGQDQQEFQRAMEKIDRAVALEPSNTILLGNAASSLMEAAAGDLLGNSMDWRALRRSPSQDLLGYLYKDQAGKQKIADKLRDHPAMIKARNYLNKLLILSPKRPDWYQLLSSHYEYIRDIDALENLVQRLKKAELDLQIEIKDYREFLDGKNDTKRVQQMKQAVKRAEETLVRARKIGGKTLAVAASGLASVMVSMSVFDQPVDLAKILSLAEEADKADSSSQTQATLFMVRCIRAHDALQKQFPEYATQAKKTRRSFHVALLTWLLSHENPLREKILAHPEIQKAIELKRQQLVAFPRWENPASWAFLAGADPEQATKLAPLIRKSRLAIAENLIEKTLKPINSSTALNSAYLLLMEGKKEEAFKVLRELGEKGVPIPLERE